MDLALGCEPIDAVEIYFLGWIRIVFLQAIRRIREKKISVGMVNEIVRAVEAATFVELCERFDFPILFEAADLATDLVFDLDFADVFLDLAGMSAPYFDRLCA